MFFIRVFFLFIPTPQNLHGRQSCPDKVFQESFSKETAVILISLFSKCKKNASVFQLSKPQNTIFLYERSKNIYLYEAIYKYIPAVVHPE